MRFSPDRAIKEANMIQDMVGNDAPAHKISEANDHLDMVRRFFKAGGKLEKRPSRSRIERFKITPKMWADALKYADKKRAQLLEAAAFSQPYGVSHRDPPFQVGCAVAGLGPGLKKGEYVVWQGKNFTPTPGPHHGIKKRCAERNTLDAAKSDCKVVFAIATSSTETSTGDPQESHDVLHPCKECRDNYRELLRQGFLREDTRIFCGNNAGEKGRVEGGTLKQLLDLYSEEVK